MDTGKALAQAIEAIRGGALGKAEAACRTVLNVIPKHFGALALLGDVLMRAGRRSEALAAYQAALQVRPDYTPLFTATALRILARGFRALSSRHRRCEYIPVYRAVIPDSKTINIRRTHPIK